MTLKDLDNKKICILGLGIENLSLLEFLLKKKVSADIIVCDARSEKQMHTRCDSIINLAKKQKTKIKFVYGKNYDKNLKSFDIIFRIAGYPLFKPEIINAMIAGVKIYSATKLFFDLCPTKNIIGVTGSKGKGTTASLIYDILKTGEKKAFLGGNIGIPVFSFLPKIKKTDWVVLELSSFQLEDLHRSPKIAVFTNLFHDHLASADPNNPNYHKTMNSYWHAKTNVFSHQVAKDTLIINDNLKDKLHHAEVKSKVIYFNTSDLETPLIGGHNKKNIAAAVLASQQAGIKKNDIEKSVKKFKGLEHRLEFVLVKDNIRYYDDSFATTPETAHTALKVFDLESVILIAGGPDKGSDFTAVAKEIKRKAKSVILFPGKGSEKIQRALKKIKFNKIKKASSMPQAIKIARQNAQPGNVILLSPACASFGTFKDYKERGKLFKEGVKKL